MAGLRWRAPTALTLLLVFALWFISQPAATLSAKGKPGRGAKPTAGQPSAVKPSTNKPSGQAQGGQGAATVTGNPGKGGAGVKETPQRGQLTAKHPLVKKVIDIQNRITPDLLKQKGIVGTSTGLDENGNIVIRVQTTGADSPKIPKQVDGVAVVEILTGPIHPFWQAPTFNQQAFQPRPVPIGVSAFDDVLLPGGCAAGTLGCRLRDKKGNVFALSNNHVFAGENGSDVGVVIGTNVVQPSPGDTNPVCSSPIPANVIGQLVKFKTLIAGGPDNIMDVAVISTNVSLVSNSTPPPPVAYGKPRTTTWIGPFLGLNVQKFGRTSGYTQGVVTGLNQIAVVPYNFGIVFFVNQLEISGTNGFASLGAPGDSGSLIVTNDILGDRFPVALLFAGGGGLTLGNPIQDVLDFLDMTIDGDDTPITSLPGKNGRSQPNEQ